MSNRAHALTFHCVCRVQCTRYNTETRPIGFGVWVAENRKQPNEHSSRLRQKSPFWHRPEVYKHCLGATDCEHRIPKQLSLSWDMGDWLAIVVFFLGVKQRYAARPQLTVLAALWSNC